MRTTRRRAQYGKFLVLDGEERELLDKVLSKTLKDVRLMCCDMM